MKKSVRSFQDHFNNVAEEVQRFAFFVRGKEFQEASIKTLEELLNECTINKDRAIAAQIEDDANAYLAFEYMAKSLIEEFCFYLALKADDPDAAWGHLIEAQSNAIHALRSHAVASHLEGYIDRLHKLELLFPQSMLGGFSGGYIVRESECNICGAEYGECNHIKGYPYMGKVCVMILKKLEIREVSLVTEPANRHCRVVCYTDEKGIIRNFFTQREISKGVGSIDAPLGSSLSN